MVIYYFIQKKKYILITVNYTMILLPLSDEDGEFFQGVDQQQLFKYIK